MFLLQSPNDQINPPGVCRLVLLQTELQPRSLAGAARASANQIRASATERERPFLER